MKASELRIGNYLALPTRGEDVVIVEEIFADDFIVCDVTSNEWPITDYAPIPITEEWLFNLGFVCEWDEYEGETREWHKGCIVFVNSDHYKIHSSWVFEPEIKYVHQLQNLYFALTGEELKTQ